MLGHHFVDFLMFWQSDEIQWGVFLLFILPIFRLVLFNQSLKLLLLVIQLFPSLFLFQSLLLLYLSLVLQKLLQIPHSLAN